MTIITMFKDAVRRGHDVSLHLHASCSGDPMPSSNYTRFNERTLPPFLAVVRSGPTRFGIVKLADFGTGVQRVQKAALPVERA